MRDEWYVARRGQDGNKRYGPVPLRQLRELVDAGKVRGVDLVWREGMAGWQQADQCPDLSTPAARPEPRGYPAHDRRGDAYGYDSGSRGYGAYDDRPYRRPYRQPSSSTWALPLAIVGGAIAFGVLAFAGVLFFAFANSHSASSSGYYGGSGYQPAAQPVDDPPVFVPDPGPPVFAPAPVIPLDPPVWVPDPGVPPDPPFIPDPNNPPPDDDQKKP